MQIGSENKHRPTRKARLFPPHRVGTVWNLASSDGLKILRAAPFEEFSWLVHGFSTRPGGASPFESQATGREIPESVLNLGFTEWDDRARVEENRRRFLKSLGAEEMELVTLRQMHSDIVCEAGEPGPQGPRGDAILTRVRGVLQAVQTADCVPILLADPVRRTVAAVHAGWRGTLRRIAEKTIGRMRMVFNTRPADVLAALGPSIGRCCYEVGPEVAREFASQFPQARDWFDGPFDLLASGEEPNPLAWLSRMPPGHTPLAPRVRLDLVRANRDILTAAGLNPANIFASEFCTACRTDLFFSHRKEDRTGRMMAAIGLR